MTVGWTSESPEGRRANTGHPRVTARHRTRSIETAASPQTGSTRDVPRSASEVGPLTTDAPAIGEPAVTNIFAAPAPSSPWQRFVGQITGASHQVAYVRGDAVGISVDRGSGPIDSLSNVSPWGAPRVLLVVQDAGDWLQVLLPIRPNESLGWIRRDEVVVISVPYRVEVDRPAHVMRVFNGEELLTEQPVAVGATNTPTPGGQFFTVELLQPPNARGAYGPFAFTLSAYSTVYQTFGSGDGAVGMHGTNQPSSIGRSASHGCVRVANDVVRWLAEFLPLGTPVYIR